MARKKRRGWTVAEHLDDVPLSFACPHCGQERKELGRWFKKVDHYICSGCSTYVPLPPETKLRLFNQTIESAKKGLAPLLGKPPKKTE